MKKKRIITRSIVILLAAAVLICAFTLTAYAEPTQAPDEWGDGEIPDYQVETAAPDDQGNGQGFPADGGYADPADDPAYTSEPTQAPDEWGGNGYNEAVEDPTYGSAYTEPEYLGELPTVNPAEIPQATAVVLPDVEVSDATLFSGIVMWLCVAVGIAVVVGVMVSKRTHRRGL